MKLYGNYILFTKRRIYKMIKAVLFMIGFVSFGTLDGLGLQEALQTSEPVLSQEMDNMVTQSIHLDDRRFAHIG
jgi:hypothetical protein